MRQWLDQTPQHEGLLAMSGKPTLPKIRAMIARSNGVPASSVIVRWSQEPRLVKYPTGVLGYVGRVNVSAPGYRTSELLVQSDNDSMRIA